MKMVMKKFSLLCLALLVAMSTLFGSPVLAQDGPNLIANTSAEVATNGQPVDWIQGGWGNNSRIFSYVDGGYDGAKSLQVTVSGYSDGDAKWYAKPTTVSPNTSYTYRDFYISNVTTGLVAQLTDVNGNDTYQTLKSTPIASDWQQTSVTVMTAANTKEMTIFHLIAGNGILKLDNAYLGLTAQDPVVPPVSDGSLIVNGSLETATVNNLPLGWNTNKWGTNAATFNYDSKGRTGSRSVSVNMTSHTDGDAKWYANPVSINPGTKYTYAGYYKSNVGTEVIAQFQDTAGNYTYQTIAAPAAAGNWAETKGIFTAPANAKYAAIFHVIAKVGTLQIDDVSLTAGSTAPSLPTGTNLVPNNSFETAASGSPASWQAAGWGNNDRSFAYLTSGHTGNRSAQVSMTNRTDGDAAWTFPTQAIKADTRYTFSDYYKSTVATEIDARITLNDGTTQVMYLGTAVASPDWLRFERTFTVPSNAVSVTIIHLLYQPGTLATDDYSLSEYSIVGFNQALVSLTFDDAWRSVYTNALPIMQKYGLKSTQYLLSGNTTNPDYMTKAQMKAFVGAGHEIGSHTISHPDLVTLSAAQLTTELSKSKTDLQTWTGTAIKNFASPYGSYNSTVLNAIKKYYSSHRSVETGYNGKDFDVYNIKVQNIVDTTSAAEVAAWVAQAQKDKTWLVIVYHQVSDEASATGEYTTPVAPFDAQMKAVKSSGVTVKTVQQALNELLPQR